MVPRGWVATINVMETAVLPPPTRTRSPQFHEMRHGEALAPAYVPLDSWLRSATSERLEGVRRASSGRFHRRGITFAVYGDTSGAERLIPFDIIPRVLDGREWSVVEKGCIQRVQALNCFLADVYGKQRILEAGVIPKEAVLGNKMYEKAAAGIVMPNGVHSHISGVDLVRVSQDQWYVLEDNLRTPSGVSYMLENRATLQRLVPDLFRRQAVRPVDQYPALLLQTLRESAPVGVDDPTIAVMTPGAANSAYFEHGFLASRMGVHLVEGNDLFVERDRLYMRTLRGPQQVHVVYRRIDDDYLDPKVFKSESVLGVPGIVGAAKAGNVTIVNAVGNGVADDKATYLYVPEMIKFYLGEDPILANVPTWRCSRPDELSHVLANIADLVVKEVHGSGGYGMLVGPTSTKAEQVAYKARILEDPSNFIAQPTLALSTCPTFVAQGIAPRHVDLRPYVLAGKEVRLVPGGLTRVALKEGSLVVNSSQGGGTKDTWVLEDEEAPC